MGTTRRQFTDGEQRDAILRRAAIAAPAAAHAPCPIAIPRFDRCLQLQLDQPQYMPVNDASGHRFERVRMRNRVEIFRQISVNHAGVVPANQPVRFLDRVDRAAARAIAIGIVLEARLEVRFQHDLGGGLNHAVPDSRDTEGTFAATRPRDRHPRTGSGRYVFETRSSRKPANQASKPDASICSKVTLSTPAAPALARANVKAWRRMSSRQILS